MASHDQQEMIRISTNAIFQPTAADSDFASSTSRRGSSSRSMTSSSCNEIDEEEDDFVAKNDGLLSSPLGGLEVEEEDCVYVAVGKTQSSMDALAWTLTNYDMNPTATIYLILVFPEIRQAEKYKSEKRERRKVLLQNYLDLCSSFKIQNKVDAVLIESDAIAKTILSLVRILNITKLVLGTTSRRGKFRKNGIAHQVYINVPAETCGVTLVCQGKQVKNPTFATPTRLSPSSSRKSFLRPTNNHDDHQLVNHRRSVGCHQWLSNVLRG